MATAMIFSVNVVDADVTYVITPAYYIDVNLTTDYLIWSATLDDLMGHIPTSDELNKNATIISDSAATTIAKCLLMDYSHVNGYYTRLVKGMSEDKRYVFTFRFDGITATIPRLEAWDDSDHDSQAKHVLGAGTPANSWVKAVKTTGARPGAGWVGTAIAGVANYVELDSAVLSGAKDLYCNLKITIPQSYTTPSAELFCLTIRYTYL